MNVRYLFYKMLQSIRRNNLMSMKLTLAVSNDDGLVGEHEFIINETTMEAMQQTTVHSRRNFLDVLFEENSLEEDGKESILEWLEDQDG